MGMPRVVVIDDEVDLLRAVALRLQAAGFQCETAPNGREGLAKIRQQPPDAVVTDLLMPEMDGYELCRRLRLEASTAAIPVIVMTTLSQRMMEERGQTLEGVSRVLHKPFDSAILVSTLREVLTGWPDQKRS